MSARENETDNLLITQKSALGSLKVQRSVNDGGGSKHQCENAAADFWL